MASETDLREENIRQMNRASGYDYIVVCTSNEGQERYWQQRLEATRGQVTPADAQILAVHEDWEGGAGNGLGTLYAFHKAARKAASGPGGGVDLMQQLAEGKSVALFHTAGKGTRLAPLPGSENNNKPGVKLPGLVKVGGGREEALTILEAVIKQTGVYAPSRGGRLSVFWGDQVFVPSASPAYEATHHADILCSLAAMPTADEWRDKGLEKYGLIAVNAAGDAAQVEKVTHATAMRLLQSLGELRGVGTSLGSFSVSHALLGALLAEFAAEIEAKRGKLDADPHFWMPMTLPKEAYQELMAQKGVDAVTANAHHDRIDSMLKHFRAGAGAGQPLFGAVDVGRNCYWWDYGQLALYVRNNVLVTQQSAEADALRLFLGVPAPDGNGSCAMASTTGGTARNSVVVRSTVAELDVTEAMLVNVTARRITGRNCLLYNVADDSEEGLVMEDGEVRADVFFPSGTVLTMRSTMDTHGGNAWHEAVCGNACSFNDVFVRNADVQVLDAVAARDAAHDAAKAVVA